MTIMTKGWKRDQNNPPEGAPESGGKIPPCHDPNEFPVAGQIPDQTR